MQASKTNRTGCLFFWILYGDLFKCIYCGFCEEACPVDAIVETRIADYHFEKRGENILTKDKLLAIGDRMEVQIAKDRAIDAEYR